MFCTSLNLCRRIMLSPYACDYKWCRKFNTKPVKSTVYIPTKPNHLISILFTHLDWNRNNLLEIFVYLCFSTSIDEFISPNTCVYCGLKIIYASIIISNKMQISNICFIWSYYLEHGNNLAEDIIKLMEVGSLSGYKGFSGIIFTYENKVPLRITVYLFLM